MHQRNCVGRRSALPARSPLASSHRRQIVQVLRSRQLRAWTNLQLFRAFLRSLQCRDFLGLQVSDPSLFSSAAC